MQKRQHVTLCFKDDDIGMDRWIEVLERILPGGALVTAGPHTGYCVAGDQDWMSNVEQERRWAALDASVPCAHTVPGTCDHC